MARSIVNNCCLRTIVFICDGAESKAGRQSAKQVKLTDKQIHGFIAAEKDLAPLSSKLESTGDQPDAALQTEIDNIAKKNGFSTAQEMDDVAANISLVLGGP